HGDGRAPGQRHRDETVAVGEFRIGDEHEGAEARHVERDSGQPPRNLISAGEEIARLPHPLPEIEADERKQREVADDDYLIGNLQIHLTLAFSPVASERVTASSTAVTWRPSRAVTFGSASLMMASRKSARHSTN